MTLSQAGSRPFSAGQRLIVRLATSQGAESIGKAGGGGFTVQRASHVGAAQMTYSASWIVSPVVTRQRVPVRSTRETMALVVMWL